MIVRQNNIIEKVCHHYGISYSALIGSCREARLVFPRHLCMFLLRKELKMPVTQIGQLFGRHHATVLHAVQSINNYIETDSQGLLFNRVE